MESGDGGFGKIIFSVLVISVVFLSIISFVSSNSVGASIGGPFTIVSGTVYYTDTNQPVPGTKVDIICTDKNHVRRTIKKDTFSGQDGTYSVVFNGKLECSNKDHIIASVVNDGLTWKNTGTINKYLLKKLNIPVGYTTPTVPEFGLLAGTLTVLGAVGVFFIIRRR